MGIRINANGKKVNQTYWQNVQLIGNSLAVNYLLDFGATISDICVSIEEKNSFLAQETFEFLCNRFQLHNNIRLQGWRQVDGWLGFLYEKRVFGEGTQQEAQIKQDYGDHGLFVGFFCAMGIIVCCVS